jgi:hypothetical protein
VIEERGGTSGCSPVRGHGSFEGIADPSSASMSPAGDGGVRLGDLVVRRHFYEVDGVGDIDLRCEKMAMKLRED